MRFVQLDRPNKSRRQQTNIDPAHAATVQAAISNEREITVGDHLRLMPSLIGGQKLPAASPVADEEFSINQLVPAHFIQIEDPV